MSLNTEIRMTDHESKHIRLQLIMAAIFFVGHAHLLITAIDGLPFALAHSRNFPLIVFVICWAIIAIVLSGWYFILFSFQVKSTSRIGGELIVHRFLAPDIRICHSFPLIKQVAVVVPSFSTPYYRRGILFIAGLSSFFMPDAQLEAKALIDQAVCNRVSEKGPGSE